MKFQLLALSLATVFMSQAASVTKPEADKYYKIKHISGLYMTDSGMNVTIENETQDNSQVFQFLPVAGASDTYNIVRVKRGQFLGSDKGWTSTIISRNINLSQFVVTPSKVSDGYVILKNVGLSQIKGGDKYLGTDNTTDKSSVYTDKSGDDTAKHQWSIEETEYTPSVEPELPDVYPDNNIPDTDLRANVYPGYKLVFAEEFSGEGKTNSEVWNYETGFCRNHEHQYYDGDNNCYMQDGVLVIEAKDILALQRRNPKYNKHSTGWPGNIGQYLHWTSGSMTTKGDWQSGYTWLYGIYEVRAKVPQMVGCWPAIWSTGREHEWPYGGEIDIMEYYGHAIHGNVCWGNGGRYSASWNSAIVSDGDLGAGWGDEFHTWRMFWDYDHIELWCDDWLVNNIDLNTTYNAIPDQEYDHGNGCNPFRDVRHMLWLNLALGGDNGGSLNNTKFPCRFLVDYARVYQKFGTDGKATYHVDETISDPTFTYKDGEETPLGVNAMTEDSDAPSHYYNLQGVEIRNPEMGQLVICRQGNKVSKLIVR